MSKKSDDMLPEGLDDREVLEFGQGGPGFLPWGDGRYLVKMVNFYFYAGRNGKKYRVDFEILESSQDNVIAGTTRSLEFDVFNHAACRNDAERTRHRAELSKLRACVCAIVNQDPKDPNYSLAKDLVELREGGEALEQLSDAGEVPPIEITTMNKVREGKKTITLYSFKRAA